MCWIFLVPSRLQAVKSVIPEASGDRRVLRLIGRRSSYHCYNGQDLHRQRRQEEEDRCLLNIFFGSFLHFNTMKMVGSTATQRVRQRSLSPPMSLRCRPSTYVGKMAKRESQSIKKLVSSQASFPRGYFDYSQGEVIFISRLPSKNSSS